MSYPFAAFADRRARRTRLRSPLSDLRARHGRRPRRHLRLRRRLDGLGAAPVGLDRALAAGLYPFVLVDVLKVVLAASILPVAWKLLPRA